MSLASYRNIVVLTGAGLSQAGGLPTYRGAGGLWSDPELIELAEVSALTTHRAKACGMFWQFRRAITGVEPTAAHRALAALARAARHAPPSRCRAGACGVDPTPPDAGPPVRACQRRRPSGGLLGGLIPPEAE